MMRIFLPGLLLLVALIIFVVSTSLLYYLAPLIEQYLLTDSPPSFEVGTAVTLRTIGLLLSMLLSVWAANWAWERIRRDRAGRID